MKYWKEFLFDEDYKTIKTNKQKEYINIECSFDIETTSMYINEEKVSFMYIWTFGLKDERFIYYGRTWQELMEFLEIVQETFNLNEDRNLICFIHNLGYEFQFMRKYFTWLDVFSIEERKPLKAVCSLGIEFRDSYLLSGYSLGKLADNLQKHTIKKLGDFDYKKIRHYETPITEQEFLYCRNDVLILLYYINEQIEIYKDITKIPLTNTGRVRKYVRDMCYYSSKDHKKTSKGKYTQYRNLIEDLTLNEDSYNMLKRCFMGGFTHSNGKYTDKIIDDVTSIDFTSSYPAVMLTELFPMSRPIPVKPDEYNTKAKYLKLASKYNLMFNVKFENLQAKFYNENYLSKSKCYLIDGEVENNGRIFRADSLTTTITEIDFEIISQCYTWDSIYIDNMYKFYKAYLPKPILQSVINLYKDKTELKGVKGKEVEYLLSKGMLNSIYGMTVTDIVRNEITYNDDWGVTPADVDEQITDYNTKKSRFLYYPWGVWVTAYARRNLWSGIININEDYIYSDTDSIKMRNYKKHKEYINKYNEIVKEKLKSMCKYNNFNFEDLQPETQNGVKKLIGVWDFDGEYSRFKTLGAKRYLVEYKDTKELEITVAGLGKKNGVAYMKNYCNNNNFKVFEMFTNSLYIPKGETGKSTHTYIDKEHTFICKDYLGNKTKIETLSGVHLEECDFTLSISDLYINFLNNIMKGYLFTGMGKLI